MYRYVYFPRSRLHVQVRVFSSFTSECTGTCICLVHVWMYRYVYLPRSRLNVQVSVFASFTSECTGTCICLVYVRMYRYMYFPRSHKLSVYVRQLYLSVLCVLLLSSINIILFFTARRHSWLCWSLYMLRSERPAVCLSVTFRCFVETNEATIMQFSPSGRTIILVSGEVKIVWKFAGDHP